MPEQVLRLSPLEAAVASNLSIPRPVNDLALRLAAQSGETNDASLRVSQEQLTSTLDALANAGVVKSLGDGQGDPRQLIGQAAEDPDTIDVHHDVERNFGDRLLVPTRAWRAHGEQFMLTKDGLTALQIPDDGPRLPLFANDAVPSLEGEYQGYPQNFASVAEAVANEYKRTWHDHPDFDDLHQGVLAGDQDAVAELNDPRNAIAHRLLPWEFNDYLSSVANTGERRELVDRLGLPQEYREGTLQGGAGWADATENLILDAENGKGTYGETPTTALFMALVETTQPTDTDTAASIDDADYTGYARKALAAADFNAASGGQATNANAITWAGCTGGTKAAIAVAKTTTSPIAGAGRLIKYNSITSVTISTTQTPPTIASPNYVTSAD